MENNNDDLMVKQAQDSLIDFAIATDTNYQDSWFHEVLASILQSALEKVEQGENVRIILECPPRHGKSELTTKKFPAWILGHHPDWPVLVASYSTDLAYKFGQATRDIMQSSSYQKIFNARLRADTKAKGYWMTEDGGSYSSAGIGTGITGTGFRIGIIDDPIKDAKEAESQVVRDSIWDWYRSTFYTRQNENTAIIVVMTRWHMDDLVGRLIEQERKNSESNLEVFDTWTRVKFPAIAIDDEKFRKKGEALWPEKYPLKELRRREAELGVYSWAALYQAMPVSSESQEFKNEWFKSRSWEEVQALKTRKFATIDPGGKNLENDYTGIIRNYVDKENMWNLKALAVHLDSRELLEHVFTLHDEGFEKIGIEETVYLKAVKPFYDEECRRRNKFPNIIPLKQPSAQKEVRIRGLIPRYSSGSIYHIEGACRDLEDQLMVFPKGAHDDVPDALAMQHEIAEAPVSEYDIARVRSDRLERRKDISSAYGL